VHPEVGVLGSLALGIIGGVSVGRFFGDFANPDRADLGRGRPGPGRRLAGPA
jgi:hypothetical protein